MNWGCVSSKMPPYNRLGRLINSWILTGNTRSKCFVGYIGGFIVTFSGEQILKGTYGGEEGIDIPNDRILSCEYVSISVPPPCEPIVIRRQTPIPIESIYMRIGVLFYELSHRTLGQGAAQQGFVQVEQFTAAKLMGHPFFVHLQVLFLLFTQCPHF